VLLNVYVSLIARNFSTKTSLQFYFLRVSVHDYNVPSATFFQYYESVIRFCEQVLVGESLVKQDNPTAAIKGLFGQDMSRSPE
jgi:hypothetical protein